MGQESLSEWGAYPAPDQLGEASAAIVIFSNSERPVQCFQLWREVPLDDRWGG
jgi:hypothetical protein